MCDDPLAVTDALCREIAAYEEFAEELAQVAGCLRVEGAPHAAASLSSVIRNCHIRVLENRGQLAALGRSYASRRQR